MVKATLSWNELRYHGRVMSLCHSHISSTHCFDNQNLTLCICSHVQNKLYAICKLKQHHQHTCTSCHTLLTQCCLVDKMALHCQLFTLYSIFWCIHQPFSLFSLSQCMQQWLDLNPWPWDNKVMVLPLCHHGWSYLIIPLYLIY